MGTARITDEKTRTRRLKAVVLLSKIMERDGASVSSVSREIIKMSNDGELIIPDTFKDRMDLEVIESHVNNFLYAKSTKFESCVMSYVEKNILSHSDDADSSTFVLFNDVFDRSLGMPFTGKIQPVIDSILKNSQSDQSKIDSIANDLKGVYYLYRYTVRIQDNPDKIVQAAIEITPRKNSHPEFRAFVKPSTSSRGELLESKGILISTSSCTFMIGSEFMKASAGNMILIALETSYHSNYYPGILSRKNSSGTLFSAKICMKKTTFENLDQARDQVDYVYKEDLEDFDMIENKIDNVDSVNKHNILLVEQLTK